MVAFHHEHHVHRLGGFLGLRRLRAAFVPDDTVLVPAVLAAARLVPRRHWFRRLSADPIFFGFGGRVVTLASGTVSTLVRYLVSMSALTDMPGRKASLSVKRMRTWNLVASCDWLLPEVPPAWLLSFGGTGDIRHHAGEFAVLERVHFQPRLLAGLDAHHVHFADVHPRLHLVQIRDDHDFGPGNLHGAQDTLAELRIQFGDGAVERRNDGGFVQRILRAVHGGLGDVHLVVGAVELRLGHVPGGFEADEIRFRKQLLVEQFQIAFVVRLGFFQVRHRRGLGGQRGFVAGLGLVDRGDINVRVDLHQQIAFLDLLAFLDRQFDDFAADFRADGDLHDGLDFAVGHDDVGEAVARDLSVWTVMAGSRFLKTATSTSATSTSPMTEKMMIFRRFLGFAMIVCY